MKKNKKKKPLGIGLEALIPSYQTDGQTEKYVDHIDVQKIIPNQNQPRQIFSEDSMKDLVSSIKENGILQPLLVRFLDDNNSYELIAGERRFRAAKHLKIKKVPVYVINIQDEEQMLKLALIENIQRDNLSSIEEAEGYAILRGKYAFSDLELANKIGKSRSTIANKLRLIKLPPELKNALRAKDSDFTEGHARALLSLRESKKMKNLFRRIKRDKLSVREVEKLVKSISSSNSKTAKKTNSQDNYITSYENALVEYLGTKVIINNAKSKKMININFSNNSDLERILNLILNEE